MGDKDMALAHADVLEACHCLLQDMLQDPPQSEHVLRRLNKAACLLC